MIVVDKVTDRDFADIQTHCRSLPSSNIRVIRPRAKHTLGALRNLSVANARGEIVCQWDDDDLHHPQRIEAQVIALHHAGSGAVFLKDIMHFFEPYRAMFWLDWDAPGVHCHTATIMAFKRQMPRYPEVGRQSKSSEDLNVFLQLLAQGQVSLIHELPYLFTYVFHGTNTCALTHHLVALKYSVSTRKLARHKTQLCAEIARLSFDRSGVRLLSPSGSVATLS